MKADILPLTSFYIADIIHCTYMVASYIEMLWKKEKNSLLSQCFLKSWYEIYRNIKQNKKEEQHLITFLQVYFFKKAHKVTLIV